MNDASPRALRLRALLRWALDLPRPVRARIAGAPKRNDRGDPLDPEVQVLLRLEGLQSQELRDKTVDRARRDIVGSCMIVEGFPRELARTEDRRADGVPVRIYVPLGAKPPEGWPILVFLHGGGWVVGNLRSHDRAARRLAADVGCIVVALDYPLAPEHRYPVGLDRILAAFRWVRAHAPEFEGDPARVAIGGDSAGGNLGAAACLRLRDAGEEQPAFQLLLYPGLDLRCLSVSYRELGRGYLLTADSIQWYLGHYGADPLDPRASPLLEPDLAGLAPAIVTSAGFDPLRDDGEQYAERLRAAGVPVEELRFPALVHGFYNMDGLFAAADRAFAETVDKVRGRWTHRRGIHGAGEADAVRLAADVGDRGV